MTYFDVNAETQDSEIEDESNVDGEVRKERGKKLKIASSIIKKSLLILFVSVIFLTMCYLTYLGMFVFLKNQTTTVQNVTVSSEGPIRKGLKKLYISKCGSNVLSFIVPGGSTVCAPRGRVGVGNGGKPRDGCICDSNNGVLSPMCHFILFLQLMIL